MPPSAAPPVPHLTDVHVHLGQWPFRRLPHDTLPALLTKLRGQNVTAAWVCSYEALLHRDLKAVNERLLENCSRPDHEILKPIGAANLTLPHWEQDVEFCAKSAMRGVRIYPGQHSVPLDDGRFAALCDLCQEKSLVLQIVVRLEDSRTEHPQFASQPVALKPALELIPNYPKLRILFSNPGREILPGLASQLTRAGQVYFDLGMIEQTGGVAAYAKAVSPQRLVFGSHFPFFYFEAALLKLRENASQLGQHALDLIAFQNAEHLFVPQSTPRQSKAD